MQLKTKRFVFCVKFLLCRTKNTGKYMEKILMGVFQFGGFGSRYKEGVSYRTTYVALTCYAVDVSSFSPLRRKGPGLRLETSIPCGVLLLS